MCKCLAIAISASLLTAQGNSVENEKEPQDQEFIHSLDCSREELMTYFPKPIVKKVLGQSGVSDKNAEIIADELAHKSLELETLVADKAAKLNPNPFKDLNQRDLAIKIYRETLFEIFSQVLKAHGIEKDDQIELLLEEMQLLKSELFIECIKKQPAIKSEG